MSQEEQTKYFNTDGVATYLKVSKSHIANLRKAKKIPHSMIGKRIVYAKDKIDEWVENQSVSCEN